MKTTIFVMKLVTICLVVLGFVLALGSLLYVPEDLISARIAGETSLANAIGATGSAMVWLGISSLILTMAIIFNEMKMVAILSERNAGLKKKIAYWVLINLVLLIMAFPTGVALVGFLNIQPAYNCLLYGADNILSTYDEAIKLGVTFWVLTFGISLSLFSCFKWISIYSTKGTD